MAEEIQKLITVIVNDLKQALDCLLDIVQDGDLYNPTGMGRFSRKEKLEKLQKALDLYYVHFARK